MRRWHVLVTYSTAPGFTFTAGSGRTASCHDPTHWTIRRLVTNIPLLGVVAQQGSLLDNTPATDIIDQLKPEGSDWDGGGRAAA
jgi:hypothetical protein